MKAYEEYKNTDIVWIKEIPSHWESGYLKHLLVSNDGGTWGELTSSEKGVMALRSTEITIDGRFLIQEPAFLKLNRDEVRKYFLIKGDLLVTKSSGSEHHIGKTALVDKEIENLRCVYSNFMQRLRPSRKCYPKYLHYYLNSDVSRSQYHFLNKSSIGLGNLGKEVLGEVLIPFPPLPEQRQIAAYLDYKTKQIDRFIANRKKQIELLEEQKEAIINKSITIGVDNNDLEDIDTHWYSQKPRNWELLKFNASINLIHGFQFRDNDFTAEGIKVVKITQLNANGTLDLNNADTIDENRLSSFKSRIIKNGDILMALTGGTIGKIIRVEDLDEIVLQNYRVGKFEPRYKNQLSKRYLFWVLRSEKTFAQINFLLRETGQPNIGKGDFSKMFFALPPTIEEQDSIADFIEKELAERNELISKYQKQIDLMQEYKTSLISKAVTGKIDVREWQPKQTIKETV